MPLGQHPAVEAEHRPLRPGDLLFAFFGRYLYCLQSRQSWYGSHTARKCTLGATPASKCTQDVRHAISWREEPIWWWSMPECGEEATKQALQNRDHDFGDTAWAAETVFWPIQFRPVYFRPSCFGPANFGQSNFGQSNSGQN